MFCSDCMLLLALHTGLVEYSKVLCFETERKYGERGRAGGSRRAKMMDPLPRVE